MKEREIEKSILEWLRLRNIFAWKTKSVGVYDPVKKCFRRPPSDYTIGVSDIIGIYEGKPLAIEVKSKKGRLSIEQKLFIEEFKSRGGIAFVARSIDDVIAGLAA